MKRIYLPLLSLLMFVICTDVYAHDIMVANDQGVTIYYNFINNNTELEVCSGNDYYVGDVIIPASVTYNNQIYAVTSIGQAAFEDCSELTSIKIPDSVNNIESEAFWGCSAITSIDIPSGITTIEYATFYDCTGLISITIPEGVTTLEESAFGDCKKLSSIILPESLKTIGYGTFSNCPSLTSITIPDNVSTIEEIAFQDCSSLTSIIIPKKVSSIGDAAFYGCNNLRTVYILSEELHLGLGAFGDSVTDVYCYTESDKFEWDGSGFGSNTKFHVFNSTAYETGFPSADVSFDESMQAIISNGIAYKIISMTEKKAIVVAGENAYEGDVEIASSIVFEGTEYSVVAIDNKAFFRCAFLNSVTIPNSIVSIGANAFSWCPELKSIIVKEGNSVYDSRDNCNAIIETSTNKLVFGCKNSFIPNTVTSIGEFAFEGCSGLTSILIPKSVTSIKSGAFIGCENLKKVIVPDIKVWCAISFQDDDSNPLSYAGHLYQDENTEIKELIIPAGVDSISSFAFTRCSGLISILIPNSVTYIGKDAFSWVHGITTLNLNSTEIAILKNAFSNCSNLATITINSTKTTICDSAFIDCKKLSTLILNSNKVAIGENVFLNCSSVTDVYCYSAPEETTWQGRFFPSKATVNFHVYDKLAYEGKFPDASVIFDDILLTIVHNGLTYKIISTMDKTVKLVTGEEKYKGSIEIASSVVSDNNVTYTVVAIDDMTFYQCNDLTSVTIPTSVTSIGSKVFTYCNKLESIIVKEGNSVYDSRDNCNAIIETSTNKLILGCKNSFIPNTVTSIGVSAFEECYGLSIVKIPNSVITIDEYAFEGCENLISVTIGNSVTSIKKYAFVGCDKLEKVIVSDISSWCSISFENEDSNPLYYARHLYCDEHTEITTLQIPSGTNAIGDYAFVHCEGLTTLIIPNSSISVGYNTFCDCKNLVTITINSVNFSSREDAFYGCEGLTTITINSAKISIAENSFMNCTSIKDVYCYVEPDKTEWQGRFFPSSAWVNFHVFDKAAYETKFPNAGVEFDDYLLTIVSGGVTYKIISTTDKTAQVVSNTDGYVGDLKIAASVVSNNVEYSVVAIGDKAFSDCNGLNSIDIPSSVTRIGDWAFSSTGLTSITIPNSVASIGSYAFYDCSSLTSITIPNTITSIADNTFAYCSSFTSFTIPASVTSIGNEAFSSCSKLVSITIPNSVTAIGTGAFSGCSSLISITVPNGINSIADYTFDGCSSITSFTIPNSVKSIGDQAFSGCSELVSIAIPNSVTAIGTGAFSGCSSLTSITIPNTITSIGKEAFYGCKSLVSMTINSADISILGNAFFGCNGLTTITINSAKISIAENSFMNCTSIKDVYCYVEPDKTEWQGRFFPSSTWVKFHVFDKEAYETKFPNAGVEFDDYLLTIVSGGVTYKIISTTDKTAQVVSNTDGYVGDLKIAASVVSNNVEYSVVAIGDKAFSDCNGLNSIDIPSSVTRIGDWAFSSTGLTSITIPNSVTAIGTGAFSGCSSLASITVPNSITSIADYTFDGCNSISSFTIPTSVKSIGKNSFYECNSLTSIVIPNNVESIEEWAFAGCSSLSSVSISNCVTIIKDYAFCRCSKLTSLIIPNSVSTIGERAFSGCSKLSSVSLPTKISSIKEGTFEDCSELTSIAIPDGVIDIEKNAFIRCNSLKSISLGKGITNIDISSFVDCNNITSLDLNCNIIRDWFSGRDKIETVIIRDNVKSIGEKAFYSCDALSSISISNNVLTIGDFAFAFCGNLTSISIPNSITSIGNNAFWYCSGLASVELSDGVVSIGDRAFGWCSNLNSVKVHWEQPITIDENVFINCNYGTLYVPLGAKAAYENANYWKMFHEIVEYFEGSATLYAKDLFGASNLWTGYVAQKDFALPTGLEAYVITNVGTTTATASPIGYIPENEPVLLKREDTTISSFKILPGTGSIPTINLLKTYNSDKHVSNREGFVLFNDEFVLVNEGTLPAGRVFLPISSSGRSLTRGIIIEGDDTTGIGKSPMEINDLKDIWYDFQGRKLERKPAGKGIYILNGRKVVVK